MQKDDWPKKEEESKKSFRKAVEYVKADTPQKVVRDVDWRQAHNMVKVAMMYEARAAAEKMLITYLEMLQTNSQQVRDAHVHGTRNLVPELRTCVWTIVWAQPKTTLELDRDNHLGVLAGQLMETYGLSLSGGQEPADGVDPDVRTFLSGGGCGQDPTLANVVARLMELCDQNGIPRPDEKKLQELGWATPPTAAPHAGGGLLTFHPPGCRCGVLPACGGGGGGGGGGYSGGGLGAPPQLPPMPPITQTASFTFPNGAVSQVPMAMPAYPPMQPGAPPQGGPGAEP